MKKKTHPTWYPQAKVKCACGATYTVGSTVPEITVEICAACHPFFTGETKLIDTLGRVEKFQQKQHSAATLKAQQKQKKEEEEKKERRPETLREMLEKAKTKA